MKFFENEIFKGENKMTLPFNERIVNDREIQNEEDFYRTKFIGYLSPVGATINFSKPFGLGGYDSNPSTDIFQEYMMFQINNPEKYDEFYKKRKHKKWIEAATKDRRYWLYQTYIKKILAYRAKYGKYGSSDEFVDKYDMLDDDLYLFLYNCYQNISFNEGFNGNNFIMSEREFYEKEFKPIDEERKRLYPQSINDESYMEWCVPPYYHFDVQYEAYKRKRILEVLKDVMISYMGYHYVARTPRTIYTSDTNVNETFYNYLLNDFNIISLPKMIYNPSLKMYEKYERSPFLVSDREERLGMELNAIRKKIPRNERTQFYR